MLVSLAQAVGRGWEYLKVSWLVLWPTRFILGVLLVMIGLFCLDQAQDALYGAVVEWRNPLWVLAAVAFWATQSWYWARLLLSLPPVGFHAYRYTDEPDRRACYDWLRVVVPRFLGCAVFAIVGGFIIAAAGWCDGWPWLAVYVAAAVVFYLLTMERRARLTRNAGGAMAQLGYLRRAHQAEPITPPPADDTGALRVFARFGALWLVLLLAAMTTAWFLLTTVERKIGGDTLIGALLIGSLWTVYRLDEASGRKWFIALLIVFDAGLFLLSITGPAEIGMSWGPAVILMLAAAVWVGATSFFLALPGQRFGLPVTTLLVVGMLLFAAIPSWFNHTRGDYDNHAVRTIAGGAPIDQRMTLLQAFDQWKQSRACPAGQTCPPLPLVIVAVEGGASRSAYWGAMILGALEDAIPGFRQSVFAISSVSGGSLGAAVYQRLAAAGNAGTSPTCGGTEGYSHCAQQILEQDYLGATFFSMFNADLLQRLLPGSLLPDRATALETAWEIAWRRVMGSDDFAAPLPLRRAGDAVAAGQWLPVLLLNGASVKTGHRIVTSDVALDGICRSSVIDRGKPPPARAGDGPSLPSTVDFFCLTRELVPLSTAVHNSARFPYISPAGTLWAKDAAGHSWKADRIVDGGYFEVLGAVTIFDLLKYLEANGRLDGVTPIVLALENDPNAVPDPPHGELATAAAALAGTLGPEAGTMSFVNRNANDVWAPAIALAKGRTGRGDYAADALEAEVLALRRAPKPAAADTASPPPARNAVFLRFNLLDRPVSANRADPAMSWYLSPRSLREMKNDFCHSPALTEAFDALGTVLAAPGLADAARKKAGC